MEGFYAINTNPLDNSFCEKMSKIPGTICEHCYSRRMLKTIRQNAAAAWSANGEILSRWILPERLVPILDNLGEHNAFRFSAHGELLNETHFINLCNIAAKSPQVTCSLWTKRVDIVSKHFDKVPDNLILVYSTPTMDCAEPTVPPGFHKVFSVYTEKFAAERNIPINCNGLCKDCMLCYRKRNNVTYVNEIVRDYTKVTKRRKSNGG